MRIDITAQQVFVAGVLPATAITIETIEHLRYRARYRVGTPDLPGKPFRWQGRPFLPQVAIPLFQFCKLGRLRCWFFSLIQKIGPAENQDATSYHGEQRVLGSLFGLRCRLFWIGVSIFRWILFFLLSHSNIPFM